jgi:hypothetical protein
MKHVVTIAELHKLIPETQKLEGINFKDMKSLITNVILRVEDSGNWEYVQYIAGNPSLFIVKEKEAPVYQMPTAPSYTDIYNNSEQSAVRESNIESRKIKSGKIKNVEPSKKEEKNEPIYTPTQESGPSLFPETKMPW